MRQKLLFSTFGVVLLGMIAAPTAPDASRTGTNTPESATMPRPVLRLSGTTFAEHSADLRAPRLGGQRSRGSPGDWGLVLVHLAPAGTAVKKGEIVARFDPLYMENRLDDMRALRIERETAVEVLRANLDVQRTIREQSLARAKAKMEKAALDLQTAPIRSEIQTEIFRLSREEAELEYRSLLSQARDFEVSVGAQIRDAELQLAQAVLEEKRAQANLDRMIIRAPVDGIVVIPEIFRGSEFGSIQVGDQISPGQYFMQIADRRHMAIRALASQTDLQSLRVGARAQVHFEAFPELQLPATVYAISPIAESGGTRTDHVKKVALFLRLGPTPPQVIPDLTVAADIEVHDDYRRISGLPQPADTQS